MGELNPTSGVSLRIRINLGSPSTKPSVSIIR